jgi:hypothetical protein
LIASRRKKNTKPNQSREGEEKILSRIAKKKLKRRRRRKLFLFYFFIFDGFVFFLAHLT